MPASVSRFATLAFTASSSHRPCRIKPIDRRRTSRQLPARPRQAKLSFSSQGLQGCCTIRAGTSPRRAAARRFSPSFFAFLPPSGAPCPMHHGTPSRCITQHAGSIRRTSHKVPFVKRGGRRALDSLATLRRDGGALGPHVLLTVGAGKVGYTSISVAGLFQIPSPHTRLNIVVIEHWSKPMHSANRSSLNRRRFIQAAGAAAALGSAGGAARGVSIVIDR